MKKVFLFAFATMIAASALAQTSSTSTLKIGLKGGVNLPKYHFSGSDDETKSTTNFNVTAFLDAPLASHFSVQPGISLQGKGAKFYDGNNIQVEQNALWIEVPVNFVGHLPLSTVGGLYLGAGPYLGFGVAGQNKTTVGSVTNKDDISFGNDADNSLKGTDFGVNFIGGFEMNNGITLGAGYGLGLTDLTPKARSDDSKVTNRVLSFSIGFQF